MIPILRLECAKRGLSFFEVDLRWGILERKDKLGHALDICLQEIENCKPYFIGILGNRYGWIPDKIPNELKIKYPKLKDDTDLSITNIEFELGLLNDNDLSSFSKVYIRSEELSERLFESNTEVDDLEESELSLKKLNTLKNNLRDRMLVSLDGYTSVEEFGNKLIEDFLLWLEKEFPIDGDVIENKLLLRREELSRVSVKSDELKEFLDKSTGISYIYSSKSNGKSGAVTNYLNELNHNRTIFIDLSADDSLWYWPEVCFKIANEINKIDSSVGYPELKVYASIFFWMAHGIKSKEKNPQRILVTDEEIHNFKACFKKWLQDIKLSSEVVIVINDVNKLSDWHESNFLTWLPSDISSDLRLILTGNNELNIKIAKLMKWNLFEFDGYVNSDLKQFAIDYLALYSKKLDPILLNTILEFPVTDDIGILKLIMDYLRFEVVHVSLSDTVESLKVVENYKDLYETIYQETTNTLDANVKNAYDLTFKLLSLTRYGINESDLFKIVEAEFSISKFEWIELIRCLKLWLMDNTSYLYFENESIKSFFLDKVSHNEITKINQMLGSYYAGLLDRVIQDFTTGYKYIKHSTRYSKEILWHYSMAEDYESLHFYLKNVAVIDALSKLDRYQLRSAWLKLMINTEYSIVTTYSQLIDSDEWSNKANLQQNIEHLICELGMRKSYEMVTGKTSLPKFDGLISYDNFSDEFMRINNKLSDTRLGDKEVQMLLLYARKLASSPLEEYIVIRAELVHLLSKIKPDSKLNKEILDKAIEQCIDYAILSGNENRIVEAIRLKCSFSVHTDSLHDVIVNCDEVIKLETRIGNLMGISVAYESIAKAYARLENEEKAISYYNKQLKLFKLMKDIRRELMTDLNIANVHTFKKNYEKALHHYEQLLIKAREHRVYEVVKLVEGNIIYVANILEKYDVVKKMVTQIGKSKGLEVNDLLFLAEIYEKEGNIEGMLLNLRELQEHNLKEEKFGELFKLIRFEEKLLIENEKKDELVERMEIWKSILIEQNQLLGLKKTKPEVSEPYIEYIKDNKDNDYAKLLEKLMGRNRQLDESQIEFHGQFGYEATNPIIAQGPQGSREYLDRLTHSECSNIKYFRKGIIKADNLPNVVDAYCIVNADTNQEICDLFVYMYSNKTSTEAPEGFDLCEI